MYSFYLKIGDHQKKIIGLQMLPGSYNDQSMWNISPFRRHMEYLRLDQEISNDEGNYYILGTQNNTKS